MWKDKVILKPNETLTHESSRTKGFMGEEEIDVYSITQPDGTRTGTVTVSDHTAVKGFKRTISVVQQDSNGVTVVDVRFSPDRA